MEREKLADVVLQSLRLENRKPDLTDWENMVENLRHPDKTVKIAMVGKYTQLHDAYLSVVEALKHGGISCRAKVDIVWVDSEELNEKKPGSDPSFCRWNSGSGRIRKPWYRRNDPWRHSMQEFIRSHTLGSAWNADGYCRICPPCAWI